MSSNYVYILGAEDAEMICIEKALRALALPFVYASKDNVRVTQENAYSANGFMTPPGIAAVVIDNENTTTTVTVECNVTVKVPSTPTPIDFVPDDEVDHHRAGDAGYGGLPAVFFDSSSLGQVYAQLIDPGEGFTVPQVDAAFGADRFLIAAADHCLAAAYQEQCPDITFAAMLNYRAGVEAVAANKPVKVIKDRFVDDAAVIRSLPNATIGALTYRIATNRPVVYHAEAAAMVNVAVEFETKEPKNKTRVSIVGVSDPAHVLLWVTSKLDTVKDIVSEQYRGYAYGYKKY